MDPRLSYITPFFFMAFGAALYFFVMKAIEFIKKRRANE